LKKRINGVCFDSKNLRIAGNARTAAEAIGRVFGSLRYKAWIILLVATQQTVTNLVRSGRKQR